MGKKSSKVNVLHAARSGQLQFLGSTTITTLDHRTIELVDQTHTNHDCKTDASELHGPMDMGVVDSNRHHAVTRKTDKGNCIGMVSSYTKDDGSQGEMIDLWFGKNKAAAAPAMTDLLSGPAVSAASVTDSVAPLALVQSHGSRRDELRHNGPLV